MCPSHTDLVTLTRLCQSEASVKLLHGLGPRGHVMPLSHGLPSGSMHIHEPLCFISLVYEFWREDYSILATYSLEFVLQPPDVEVWFWNVIVPIRGWVVWESSSPHCTNFMKIIYIYTFTAPSKPKAQKEHHCHPKLNTRRIHLEDKIGRRMGLPFPHKYFKPFTCYHFFFNCHLHLFCWISNHPRLCPFV